MVDPVIADAPLDVSISELLAALRAVAEPTRLRLLVLCSRGELTVSELAQILGQSQPRVSRHLKLLCEAGLLDRFREGSWVFYRISAGSTASTLARHLVAACGERDPTVALDLQRLAAIKRQRAERAAAYFSENAPHWDRIRSLYIDEREVEAALVDVIAAAQPRDLLDIGTGTGRMLEILGPRVGQALGIDQSREMLAIARRRRSRKRRGCCGQTGCWRSSISRRICWSSCVASTPITGSALPTARSPIGVARQVSCRSRRCISRAIR